MRAAINRLHQTNGFRSTLAAGINQPVSGTRATNDFINSSNSLIDIFSARFASTRYHPTRLAEVGRFEVKQSNDDCYLPGQPFLHQIFGYRGVILFPWLARVHDIDARKKTKNDQRSNRTKSQRQSKQQMSINENEKSTNDDGRIPRSDTENPSMQDNDDDTVSVKNSQTNVTNKLNNKSSQFDNISIDDTIPPTRMNANSTRFEPYYQVLIDTRDCPFVSCRTQTEAVTFLGHPDNSKSVYSIKGLDYVAHEDIIPYTSYEETPIHHELHGKLFRFNQEIGNKTRYDATDLLESWRNKHPWLELSRVYRETTENVRVTVIPFYLGHTTIEDISFHWWRYCVRLENFGDTTVQLRERHWKIFSQTNMLQTIKGRGVVGVEPILTKSEPAYQYSSHVNLQDKSGHMWGTFKMQREDGHTFECRIPPFSLESCLDNITPPASKR